MKPRSLSRQLKLVVCLCASKQLDAAVSALAMHSPEGVCSENTLTVIETAANVVPPAVLSNLTSIAAAHCTAAQHAPFIEQLQMLRWKAIAASIATRMSVMEGPETLQMMLPRALSDFTSCSNSSLSSDDRIALAFLHVLRSNTSAARICMQGVEPAVSRSEDVHMLAGYVYHRLGQPSDAVSEYTTCTYLNRLHTRCHVGAAVALASQEQLRQATTHVLVSEL